jgi:hypothetical protein
MFKKVSNADLLNSLLSLQNKIDIMTTNMNSKLVEGCCDCKSHESLVYKQLHEYLEEKFLELNKNLLKKFEETDIVKRELVENTIVVFNDTFHKYRDDIMTNLQTIISNLSLSSIDDDSNRPFCANYIVEQLRNEITNYKQDKERELYEILNLYSTINRSMEDKLVTLSDLFQTFTEDNCKLIISMDKKLDSIYFENELIKHQLSLEDEIRKLIDEVSNIHGVINNTISSLDVIIKKQ